ARRWLMDDSELVGQVLQGNLGAYVDLVRRYAGQIAALCRARVHHPEAVDDLVQETFLRGLDHLASLREPDKFGSWLYTIARRLSGGWPAPPHRRHLALDDASLPATLAPGDDQPDRTDRLRQCVRHLPEVLREVVEIYYSGGPITYQQLADRLGVSFGLVNQRLTQAKKLLRACLEHGATA